MRRTIQTVSAMGVALAAASPLGAVEVVRLATGFVIEATQVEFSGEMARLTTGAGELQIPRAKIANIDSLADPMPDPAPAAVISAPVAPIPAPPPTPPAAPRSAEQILEEAANRYGLPPALVRSVAQAESGIRQDAISPKGAIGVMQLMPETAARLDADPNDLEQNVDAGARYLRDLLVRYEGSTHKALAAYNAGERAVDRYAGIPPYEETQTYVRRVLGRYLRDTAK